MTIVRWILNALTISAFILSIYYCFTSFSIFWLVLLILNGYFSLNIIKERIMRDVRKENKTSCNCCGPKKR